MHLSTPLRISTLVLLLVSLAAAAGHAEFRLEKDLALAPGGRFVLDTDAGSIAVRGSDRSGARIVVTSPRNDLEERFAFTFDQEVGGVTVRARKRGASVTRWFGSRSESLRFEVELPFETAVDLTTAGGQIGVESIGGEVKANTSGGRIELSQIGGEVDAHTSGGSIRIEEVAGDLEADTSGGPIVVRGVAGRVTASSSGGPVTAYFAPGNDRGGSLSTSGGRVTAFVDPGIALDIDASTSGGRVTLDLPVSVRGKQSRSSARGTLNGGGSLLRLRSSGGGIALKSL